MARTKVTMRKSVADNIHSHSSIKKPRSAAKPAHSSRKKLKCLAEGKIPVKGYTVESYKVEASCRKPAKKKQKIYLKNGDKTLRLK